MSEMDSALDVVLNEFKYNLNTVAMGVILSYDSDTSLATVRPANNTINHDDTEEVKNTITALVLHYGNDDFLVHHEILENQPCLLLWNMRDLEKYSENTTSYTPTVGEFMEYKDVLCLPFKLRKGIIQLDGISLQKKDGTAYIHLRDSGEIMCKNPKGSMNLKDDGEIIHKNDNGTIDLHADGEATITTQGGSTEYKNDKSILFQNGAIATSDGDLQTNDGISLRLHGHIGNLGNPVPSAFLSGLGGGGASDEPENIGTDDVGTNDVGVIPSGTVLPGGSVTDIGTHETTLNELKGRYDPHTHVGNLSAPTSKPNN